MSQVIEAYLQHKGWSYKLCGLDNYSVEVCPICGDAGSHFGIHKELGLWKCLKCEESGNLYTLKRQQGDISEPKQASPEADPSFIPDTTVEAYCQCMTPESLGWQHLISRGITPDAIKHFRLGLAYDDKGYWITIPDLKDTNCTDIKFKSVPPANKMFRKVTGAVPCLYNETAIKGESEAIIVEGELDCISLWQLGYTNVVSVPFGCDNFKPEYWDTLADKKKIYIIFDTDTPGRRGAKKLAERLDPARCYEVILPGIKDANEFICSGGDRKQLDYIINQSKPYGKPTTYGALQALNELSSNLEDTGQLVEGPVYPWEQITGLFGPMAPGEMTVVLGAAGVGKTSFALQILTYAAMQCKTPSLLLCLEMPIHRLSQLLVSQSTLCDRNQVKNEDIVEAMATLYGAPLFLARRPALMTWENIKELMVGSIRRFGIKVWAFDNIQFLCRGSDMTQQVGLVSKRLKELAEDTNTHAIVVSHPRKAQEGNVPTMYDAAWSQALSADADGMISIYRKPLMKTVKEASVASFHGTIGSYDDKTLISAAKTRYGGGGSAVLWLDGPSGRFMKESKKPR